MYIQCNYDIIGRVKHRTYGHIRCDKTVLANIRYAVMSPFLNKCVGGRGRGECVRPKSIYNTLYISYADE
jgi:hypothetical protein